MSSNNFFINLFTCIKISKDSSAKYYQFNKERLQKKVFLKKKKNSNSIFVNNIKIYQTMKRKLVEYRKKYYKMRKKLVIIK